MITKIQTTIDTTLASLITLEDKQGKTHSTEWQRLEGYYYGLLDALNELEETA
jgi:hypothetical protein